MSKNSFLKEAMYENHPQYQQAISRNEVLYQRKNDLRSPFSRDYNRIIFSLAYRRLKHKTQVFFAVEDDHVCTRSEHVNLVDSVSYTIAHYLGLNTELTRAIAVGHDLGHAPFGHGGEKIINQISKEHGLQDFWHEKNSLYFVDQIETLEDDHHVRRNLNLTYAVRDGIISHCGELDENSIRPRENWFDLKGFDKKGKFQAATWEGCVVRLADKIAYLGRDIEDAIRLNYLSAKDKEFLQDMARVHNESAINTTVIMHNMIIDLCNSSSPETGLTLSKEMSKQLNEIKRFNETKIYNNPRLNTFKKYSELVLNEIFVILLEYYDKHGQDVIGWLSSNKFDGKDFVEGFCKWIVAYCDMDFSEMQWAEKIAQNCLNKKIYSDLSDRKKYIQAIIDYMAGMTDVYALNAFEELLKC